MCGAGFSFEFVWGSQRDSSKDSAEDSTSGKHWSVVWPVLLGRPGRPVYLLIPFYAVFIAGTANYYNFMDGINGITGVVGFGLVAWFAALSGGPCPFGKPE